MTDEAPDPQISGALTAFFRARYWLGAVAGLVVIGAVAGFSTLAYLDRYATAASLDRLEAAQAASERELAEHVVTSTARISALEASQRNIEADYHQISEQLWRIADRIGARHVDPPEHVIPGPSR